MSNFKRRAISFFGTPSTRCKWRISAHCDILITSAASWLSRRDDRASPRRSSPGNRCFRVLRRSLFKWPQGPFLCCRYHSGSVRGGLRCGVRVRSAVRDPRDRLELRQTEPVPAVVPRIRRAVQSGPALRAPTPWTTRSASAAVAIAAFSSRSARPATEATPTARHPAGRSVAGGRCRRRGLDISAVPKGASTTATGSAPIAFGAA